MRNSLLAPAVSVPLLASAQSLSDESVKHAAQIVAQLHDTMLDPASFVLDGVYVTKPVHRFADKDHKDSATHCYAFRSHSTIDGYSEARAYAGS